MQPLWCVMHVLQQTREYFSNLLHRLRWCCQDGAIIHALLCHSNHPIDLLVYREQQVKDYLPSSSGLRNHRYWGDLEVCWQTPLEVIPQEHPAKTGLDLIFDVFNKEGNRLGRSGHGMRAAVNRCLNYTPLPIWATVHGDALLPFPKDGRERVHLSQRLRLY